MNGLKKIKKAPSPEAILQNKTVEYAILVLLLVLFAAFVVIAVLVVDFERPASAVNAFLSFITIVFSILIYSFCISGYTWDVRQKCIFEETVVLFFFANLLLFLTNLSEVRPEKRELTMTLYTLLYLSSAIYWLPFWFFQRGKDKDSLREKLRTAIYFVFFGCYTAVTIVNHFTGFCFYIDMDGSFVIRSSWLFRMTYLWFALYFVMALTSQNDLRTKIAMASYSLMPIVGWLLFIPFGNSAFYNAIFTNLAMFFYLVSIYLLFFNIYIENGRLFLQREKELVESRANAMVLKIRPHFIANTMSSIVALCDPGAPEAGKLAAKFARYLRDNYVDITDEPMVPFSKELEHIRNYLEVEQIRFAGLKVEYDIEAEDFYLPTLTVQPLVENAVRHGVSKRPDASGTVTLRSFEDKKQYVIRISDDGVGFDSLKPSDGQHIGITNAEARLDILCSGTLEISSLPGKGTVCEIRIPKSAR